MAIRIKKNSRSQDFLTIFAWWRKDLDPSQYLGLIDPDPGGPKTYGSGTMVFGNWTEENPRVFFFSAIWSDTFSSFVSNMAVLRFDPCVTTWGPTGSVCSSPPPSRRRSRSWPVTSSLIPSRLSRATSASSPKTSHRLSRYVLHVQSGVADTELYVILVVPSFRSTVLGWSRKLLFLLTRNSYVAGSTKIRIITRNYCLIKPSYA